MNKYQMNAYTKELWLLLYSYGITKKLDIEENNTLLDHECILDDGKKIIMNVTQRHRIAKANNF